MTSEDKDRLRDEASPEDQSRRDFVALSAAVGIAATAAGTASAAQMKVVEHDVNIQTPDGTCDAAFFHPAAGKHPGVIIWTDIFGLRPTFRGFGRRLAASGYSVLVPNPFYRTAKSPVFTEDAIGKFDFRDPAARAKMGQITGPINAPGAIETDAKAHIGFLDSQRQVDTSKKIGTQGYCMGGPLVFKTCAVDPDRVGAGATFHGGGLVTDKPDSPHLLIPKFKARMYIAIATSDDVRQPDAKDKLREAFKAANVQAEVVVYQGMQHGWTVPDMPHQANGQPIYNKPEAEKAWGKLLELYRATLA
ncbi:MAG TPA: dienelactone hydrolase family protein [Steroidobacteraceae bacterium]|jgi:carboxymethylenebutenolidase|nr:dienelactone hydrolase family protein [Steroidobacteraceae bacterium]